MYSSRWLCVLLGVCFVAMMATLPGCQSTSTTKSVLPTYQWVNATQAVSLINQRAESVDSIMATGNIVLIAPNEKSGVTLSMAIVVLGEHRLRLRAWKLQQPVLDVTYNPDGLWIWTDGHTSSSFITDDAIKQLIRALRGQAPVSATVLKQDDASITLTQPVPATTTSGKATTAKTSGASGGTQRVLIDKATLTVRQYQFVDAQGKVRQAITLGDYNLMAFLPWPRRITAQGDHGDMQITFREVDINTKLPDKVFVPSSRAVKQP